MAAAKVCNCCGEKFKGRIYMDRDLGRVDSDCYYRLTRAASELACEGVAGCVPASGGFAGLLTKPRKKEGS